jgi:hypothetical protein
MPHFRPRKSECGWDPGIRLFNGVPDDSNMQPKLKTTALICIFWDLTAFPLLDNFISISI